MVHVKGALAAVGHMGPPWATTLLDVADPTRPRILSRIEVRPGTHSHKARICGSTLAINVESFGGGGDGTAGLALFDISDPLRPRATAFYRTGGSGVHRFQLDCARKLVYAGGGAGYVQRAGRRRGEGPGRNVHPLERQIFVQPQVRQVLPLGDRLMVTVAPGEAAPAPLAAALEAGGVGGSRLSPAEPALEELFVQIVRREEG